MTLFAMRIHVSFFAEIQASGTGSAGAASLQEQILHEFVKACLFLFLVMSLCSNAESNTICGAPHTIVTSRRWNIFSPS